MTTDDWAAVCFTLAEAWPGDFTPNQEAAYFDVLGGFEREQVKDAIRRVSRAPGKLGRLRPTAGEIGEAIAETWAAPPFDQAWRVIARRTGRIHDPEPVFSSGSASGPATSPRAGSPRTA